MARGFFLYMNLYISCNNVESVGYCIKYVVCFDALIELFDSMGYLDASWDVHVS